MSISKNILIQSIMISFILAIAGMTILAAPVSAATPHVYPGEIQFESTTDDNLHLIYFTDGHMEFHVADPKGWQSAVDIWVTQGETILHHDNVPLSVSTTLFIVYISHTSTYYDDQGVEAQFDPNKSYSITVYKHTGDHQQILGTCSSSQASPIVTLNPKTVTYSGEAVQIDEATVTDQSGNPLELTVSYKYFSDSGCTQEITDPATIKNVGSYYAKAYTEAQGSWLAGESEAALLKIDPKPLTPTATMTKIYDGSKFLLTDATPTAETGIGTETVTVLGQSFTYNDGVDVGTYVVQLTVKLSDQDTNYCLEGQDAQGLLTITVNDAKITPMAIAWPTIPTKIFNNLAQIADVPVSDKYTVTENTGGTVVGSYPVTLTLVSTNYKWEGKGDLDIEWTKADAFGITKGTVTTISTEYTHEYTGTSNLPAKTDLVYTGFNGYQPEGTVTIGLKEGSDGISAVTQYVLVTISDDDNLEDTDAGIEVSYGITKKELTITASAEKYFNGEFLEYAIQTSDANGLVSGDSITAGKIKTTGAVVKEGGYTEEGTDWTVSVAIQTSNGIGNYELSFGTVTLTISKKEIEIPTVVVSSITFDGQTHSTEIAETTEYAVTQVSGKVNVGEYEVIFSLKDTSNTKWAGTEETSVSVKALEITKKDLTISVTGSKPYDGTVFEYTILDADAPALVSGDSITGGKLRTIGSDVRAYTIKDTDWIVSAEITTHLGISNYTLTFGTVSLEITKVAAVITTVPVAKDLTYNGNDLELVIAAVADGGTPMYCLTLDGTYSESIPTGKNAGVYTVYYYAKGDANHSDSAKAGPVEVSVAKRTAALVWADLQFTYDAQSHIPTATVANLVAGDSCTVTVGGAQTNAGTHTATATGLSNANYALPTDPTKQFEIAKKPLTLTGKNVTKVFDGMARTITSSDVEVSGLIDGHTIVYTFGGKSSIINVADSGEYTIESVVIKDAGENDVTANYEIAKSGGTNTVTAKALAVTKETSKTYDGDILAYTLVADDLDGLVTNDELTGGAVATSSADAGRYIEQSAAGWTFTTALSTSKGIGNYEVTYDIKLIITKAPLVRNTHYSATFQDIVYDGQDHALVAATIEQAYASEGLSIKYSTDGATYSETVPTAKDIGTYTVYVKILGGDNYEDAIVSDTVEITRPSYTLTFEGTGFTVKVGDDEIQSGALVAYDAEITVAADDSYTITAIKLNGSDVQSPFKMPLQNSVLTVTVQGNTYNITYDESYAHGTVSGPHSAKAGETVQVTLTPETGYAIKSIAYEIGSETTYISQVVSAEEKTYSFTMPGSDIAIKAVFIEDTTAHSITIGDHEHGTLTASHINAAQGETVTLVPEADDRYTIQSVRYNDGTEHVIDPVSGTYSFTMGTTDVTVSATFVRLYTVTIDQTEGVSVVADKTSATGGQIELTVTPDSEHESPAVSVKDSSGQDVTVTIEGGKYVFTIADDVTVKATVSVKTYSISLDDSISGATVTPSVSAAPKDSTVTIALSMNQGYSFKSIAVKTTAGQQTIGVTQVIEGTSYTFAMPGEAVTIYCETEVQKLSVTGTINGGGTVTNGSQTIDYGNDAETMVFTPAAGTHFVSYSVNGGAAVEIESSLATFSYTFRDVTAEQTIAVTTAPDTQMHTVTLKTSPSGSGSFTYRIGGGASQTYTAPFQVNDGVSLSVTVSPGSSYNFSKWDDDSTSTTRSAVVQGDITWTATLTAKPSPGPSPGPTPGPTPTPSSETHANPDGSTTETTTKETTDRRTGETTTETTSTTTGTDGTKTVSEETTVTDKQGNSKTTSTSTTTDPEGNTTTTDYESTTKKNDDGSSTTESSSTTRSSDGSTSETTSKTETDKDGNSSTTSTTVSTDADGVTSTTTSTTTTTKGSDGSTTTTETSQTRSSDGSTERTTSETNIDKNGKTTMDSTTTATGADGITTTTVTKTEEGKGTGGTIITTTEEVSTSSDGSSHTTKTEITADGKGESRVKSTTEAIGTDGTKTTTVTESESKKNKDGSTTVNVKTEIINPDGSTVVQESETNVKTDKDGTVTTRVETDSELSDGTKVHEDTTTVVKKDGTVTQNTEVTTTAKDGSKTVSESESRTTTSDDGTVTKVTESTTEFADGTTNDATITEVRNPDGSRNIVSISETENPDGSTTESQYESEVTVDPQGRTVTKTKGTEENSDGTGKTVESTIVSQGGKDVSFDFTSVYDNLDSTTTTVKGSGTDEKVTVTLSGSRDVDVSDAMDSLTDIEAAVITIGMESKDGLKLSGDAVAEIAGESYGMWVQNGTMYLEVDSNVVSHIPTDAKEVELLIERADDTNMTKDQIPVVGDLYAVNVKLLVNGVEVHQLQGVASIVIEPGYSAAYVYYVDDEGNVELLESEYDEKTGELTFDVEHFSIYMVSAVPYEKKSGDNTVLIAGIVIAIVAILALVAFLLYRRRQAA